jgi:hypothetical protein
MKSRNPPGHPYSSPTCSAEAAAMAHISAERLIVERAARALVGAAVQRGMCPACDQGRATTSAHTTTGRARLCDFPSASPACSPKQQQRAPHVGATGETVGCPWGDALPRVGCRKSCFRVWMSACPRSSRTRLLGTTGSSPHRCSSSHCFRPRCGRLRPPGRRACSSSDGGASWAPVETPASHETVVGIPARVSWDP